MYVRHKLFLLQHLWTVCMRICYCICHIHPRINGWLLFVQFLSIFFLVLSFAHSSSVYGQFFFPTFYFFFIVCYQITLAFQWNLCRVQNVPTRKRNARTPRDTFIQITWAGRAECVWQKRNSYMLLFWHFCAQFQPWYISVSFVSFYLFLFEWCILWSCWHAAAPSAHMTSI